MNILVIGNGFDIAHELPTKYYHFIQFVKLYQYLYTQGIHFYTTEIDNSNLNKSLKEAMLNKNVLNFDLHNKHLQELDSLIHNNVWIEYFLSKSVSINDTWINFESEISKVIQSLDSYLAYLKRSRVNTKNNELYNWEVEQFTINFLQVYLSKYISNKPAGTITPEYFEKNTDMIINILLSSLDNLIKCLDIYLGEFIQKLNISTDSPTIHSLSAINCILSFNYTNTYNRHYDLYGRLEYDYIHGHVSNHEPPLHSNIVLGIDEYLEEKERMKRVEFIRFTKYFQRIHKRTGATYTKWIERMDEESRSNPAQRHNIYIFGHSLDITDSDILQKLIDVPNTTITIFHHDDDAYVQLITNLIKIIGSNKLIEYVYGHKPKIQFRPTIISTINQ